MVQQGSERERAVTARGIVEISLAELVPPLPPEPAAPAGAGSSAGAEQQLGDDALVLGWRQADVPARSRGWRRVSSRRERAGRSRTGSALGGLLALIVVALASWAASAHYARSPSLPGAEGSALDATPATAARSARVHVGTPASRGRDRPTPRSRRRTARATVRRARRPSGRRARHAARRRAPRQAAPGHVTPRPSVPAPVNAAPPPRAGGGGAPASVEGPEFF